MSVCVYTTVLTCLCFDCVCVWSAASVGVNAGGLSSGVYLGSDSSGEGSGGGGGGGGREGDTE